MILEAGSWIEFRSLALRTDFSNVAAAAAAVTDEIELGQVHS